jgi:glyoxylase-like metal-dependent hydrolase (beta-lactamase superfamily II)
MDSPLQVAILPVTAFQQNCTLLRCTKTGKGAVIDPGGEIDRLLEAAEQMQVELEKIFITHGHLDHAGGAAELAERLGLPIEGPHRDDDFWIRRIEHQGAMFGAPGGRVFTPARWLEGGDSVSFGDITLEVRHCPGHTPGHVIFFHPESRLAQVGDVLFRGSIGRTDFPKGDHAQLLASIREQLWPLGDDVTFIPGHGPTSTFGEERRSNPFVQD